MDCLFPLKAYYCPCKVYPSLLPRTSQRLQASRHYLTSKLASKQVKIRGESEARVNGALSGDFDPRFLDRVFIKRFHIYPYENSAWNLFSFMLIRYIEYTNV